MSKSTTQLIHGLIGCPDPSKDRGVSEMKGSCLVCGSTYEMGSPSKYALSKTDTDRARFAAEWSEMVCTACTWCSEGRPPDTLRMWTVIYREDGQIKNPGTFREYITKKQEKKDKIYSVSSLLEVESRVALINRSDLSPLVRAMVDPPESKWSAAIAESGHIHIVRFAPVNAGRGYWTVIFEREEISATPGEFTKNLWHIANLRQAGFHTEDIENNSPHPKSLREHTVEWFTHMTEAVKNRPDLTRLSLFLCTKDRTDDYRNIAEAKLGRDYRDDAHSRGSRLAERMPGLHSKKKSKPDEVLGLGSKSSGAGSPKGSDLRTDGERDARSAPDQWSVPKEEQQQNLFNW